MCNALRDSVQFVKFKKHFKNLKNTYWGELLSVKLYSYHNFGRSAKYKIKM